MIWQSVCGSLLSVYLFRLQLYLLSVLFATTIMVNKDYQWPNIQEVPVIFRPKLTPSSAVSLRHIDRCWQLAIASVVLQLNRPIKHQLHQKPGQIVIWGKTVAANDSIIFTALHGMQTRSRDKNSVRPSVSMSNAWIVTKRKKDILSRFLCLYERSLSLVFW